MNEDKQLMVLNFENVNLPLPTETKNTSDTTYVQWGLNNNYPSFLVHLYNESSIHSAIINQKTNYIIGDGLINANGEEVNPEVNANDNLKEFASKVIKDYLLFNAFAVEVIFNVFGQPIELHHVPMHKIRMNKTKTKFWVNDDWLLSRKTLQYERYSLKNNQDSTSKIFFFDGYFPSLNNVYSTPEYAGCLKAISTDVAIKDFNLNNIKNHFSPSTVITFFNGANVADEVKKKMIAEIERNYKGENGKKIIIDFQTKDGKSAEVKALTANDWDKAYSQVSQANTDDIMIGHQVQNPSLFAIKTAGQLGNTQELETSYEIFKANYINVKRQEIESAFNQLFTNYDGIQGKVQFKDKPLFQDKIEDSVKVQILTINELRKLAGYESLPDGNRLIGQQVAVQQSQESAPADDVKKKSSKKLTEEDYELIKDLGHSAEDFEEIDEIHFDKESDIADYLISNDIKNLTLPQIVDVLKNEGKITATQDDVQKVLDKMNQSGVAKVDVKDGRIAVLPQPAPDVPDTNRILTMYKYVKRPEASGDDLLPTSRSFCVRMIENNRLYTREEIQTMSSIFGYDIFKFCGGWWYNPETEETTSHCRHQWRQIKVRRKQ